ncbi:hypothetical protein [Helicobacter cetorum]|uniref:hypothetical protein n=1 Tax=Helicobacter cetorum TaxID=138563 RepID=UPI000CF0ACFF|nr:hypothetical protein [Helicobacter cetorum]
MQYPNLPSPSLQTKDMPVVKEITNELLKELESVLNNATLWKEQVNLSLKGVVRILEVLLTMDFFKNANDIDEKLRNSIEWLQSTSKNLKDKMQEYESYFNRFNASMLENEQEVKETLESNKALILNEIQRLEIELNAKEKELLSAFESVLNSALESAKSALNSSKESIKEELNTLLAHLKSELESFKNESLENLSQTQNQSLESLENAKSQGLNAINALIESLKIELEQKNNQNLENIKNASIELQRDKTSAIDSINSSLQSALNEIENLNNRISTTLNSSFSATKEDFLNQANSKLNTMLEPLNNEINALKQEQSNLNNNDVLIQNRLDNKLNKFNERQLDLISKNANIIDSLSTKTTSLENRLNDFPTEKIIILNNITTSKNYVNDSNTFEKITPLAWSHSVIFKANKIYLIELFLNYEVRYYGYDDVASGQLILCLSNTYNCDGKIIILNNTLRTCKNIDMSGSGNSQYPYVVKTIFRPNEDLKSLWLFGRQYQSIWINPVYRSEPVENINYILKTGGFYRPRLTNVGEYQYELYNESQIVVGVQSSYLKVSELSYLPE